MKRFNKIISIILSIIMTVLSISIIQLNSFAEMPTSGTTGDCTWSLDGTVLTISGNGAMSDYAHDYILNENRAPWGFTITDVIIEDGVTRIGDGAFYHCESLTSVTIPDSVISIGDSAFYYCKSLKSIVIPDSVIQIENSAFCITGLESLTLGKSVRSVEFNAFYGIKELVVTGDIFAQYMGDGIKKLIIEGNVTKIDYAADLADLENIVVSGDNKIFSSVDGVLFNKDKTELIIYPKGRKDITYTIPYGVTSIGEGAFFEHPSLASVDISNSVIRVGDRAFMFCKKLKNVTFGKGLKYIGSSAFQNCVLLNDLTIPQDCQMGDLSIGYMGVTPVSDFVIYGYTGSDAERYATKNKFTFISIGIMHQPKSLSVSKLPDKTTYYQGENFEVKGLELQLTYTDGETSTLTVSENYWNEGYSIDWSTYSIGTSTVTVSYAGLGTTFEINVIHNPNASIGFPDVRMGDWYYDAVKYNFERGYITGYSNGTFGPSNNIQRQDFVLILARIAGADLSAYEGKNGGFSDVATNAYYSAAVAWAKDKGIVTGYSADNFGVGTYITREQISLILCRYLGGEASGDVDAILNAYSDGGNTSPWAKAGVAWAVENGIIGNSDYLNPNGNAGRAEVAQIIYNMSNKGML